MSSDNTPGPDPQEVGYDECVDECSSSSTPCTKCDLDITNNVWVEGVVDPANGKRGICMLDSMSDAQVIYVLQHDPRARADLSRVTSDPRLLEMLASTALLNDMPAPSTQLQKQSARMGLPYYSVFRGRPPVAQPFKRKP